MVKKRLHSGLRAFTRLSLLALLAHLPISANAQSYLSELEAEANSMETEQETDGTKSWSYRDQTLSEKLPKGLSHEEFEKHLEKNHFALSIFYVKLSDWNKKMVYETYQQSHSVEKVRDEIKARMTK